MPLFLSIIFLEMLVLFLLFLPAACFMMTLTRIEDENTRGHNCLFSDLR